MTTLKLRYLPLTLTALASLLFACSQGPSSNDADPEDMIESKTDEFTLCKKKFCGPAPGMPTTVCPDGLPGGNTGRCVYQKATKSCSWEYPDVSAADDAEGLLGRRARVPGVPDELCSDGIRRGSEVQVHADGRLRVAVHVVSASDAGDVREDQMRGDADVLLGDAFPDAHLHRRHVPNLAAPAQEGHRVPVRGRIAAPNDELMSFRLATYRYK